MSITAAVLPGVAVRPIHLRADDLPSPSAPHSVWESLLGVSAAELPHFVLLPDPFSFDPDPLHARPRPLLPGRTQDRRPGQRRATTGRQRALPRRPGASKWSGRRLSERRHRGRHDRRAGLPADRSTDVRHPKRSQHHLGAGRRATAGRSPAATRHARPTRPRAGPPLSVRRHRDERGPAGVPAGGLPDPQPGRGRRRLRSPGGRRSDRGQLGRAVPSARCEDVGGGPRGALGALRAPAGGARRVDRFSSPASAAAASSTASPITTPARFAATSGTSLSAASSATARSGPCTARPSCTATPARSVCFVRES